MRKTLIIIAMALFALPMFAQTIESIDVKKSPDGKFTAPGNDCTIEGQVQDGQKTGTWIEYYAGTYLPKKIVNYEKGKKNGIFVEIDKTGSITKKAEYKDDVLDGQMSEWYRGGRLSSMHTYKNGQLEGQQVICYEQGGNLEVSHYKGGQRDGVTTWFDEKGNKKMTIEYKNGQFEGKQETFNPDGSLKTQADYKNGKLQGKVKSFDQGQQTEKKEMKEKETKVKGKRQ